MALTQKSKSKSGSGSKLLLAIFTVLLLGAGVYITMVYFEKTQPNAKLSGDMQYLGKTANFQLMAEDRDSGLRSVQFVIRQNGEETTLVDQSFPRQGFGSQRGPATFSKEIGFSIEEAGLENGEAELVVTAADYSFRGFFSGNEVVQTFTVTIDTIPPKVHLLHAERYIRNGGSGIVIYQIKGEAAKHGVQFGSAFHPGHPVDDEHDNTFVSYIALPYDAKSIGSSEVTAEDAAGNKASFPFSTVFKKEPIRTDRINVGDGFLNAKVPEFQQYYPEMKGSFIDQYVHVNRKVRQANNAKIAELCQNPESERLWDGKFIRMAGATRSGYADYRTYYYKGQEIDKQVHLGMDLASIRRADVKAANTGKVVFADYLGIYGNMVVLDHGQGVFSLYSHLSRIDTSAGATLQKGDILGLTGKTGMAGGDHLHFSILINGIFVTPIEWWDNQWIEVTIDGPLADAKF